MPIDLASIAQDWLLAWRRQQRLAGRALQLLGPWLAARLEQFALLDQRTRAWPVYAFEGRALAVQLAPSQIGIVQPYSSTGAAVAAPFLALGRGTTRVAQAVQDEWVMPAALTALARVFTVIGDSVERWLNPRAEQFNPATARASDVFGLMALAWRGLSSSLPQLRQHVTDIGNEVRALRGPAPTTAGRAPTTPPADTPVPPPEGSTGSTIERWLVGAMLVLPVLPSLIENLARAAWLQARSRALDMLQGIEARVFQLRTRVLHKILVDLPQALRDIPALAATLGAMVSWNIRYFARLAQVWFELVVFALELFLNVVTTAVNALISMINGIVGLINAIMDHDLLSIIKPLLGPAGLVIDMLGVTLSLNDLIDAGTQAANAVVYGQLKTAIATARIGIRAAGTSLPIVGGLMSPQMRALLLHKLSLIEQVVDALFANTGGPMVETAPPVVTDMPDIYALAIGRPPAEVAGTLRDFGRRLADGVVPLFEQVTTTLRGFGEVFERTAADVARTGPADRMASFGRETSELVGDLYDDQIHGIGDRIAERPVGSFEAWLVAGGFLVIGAAIPVYVQEMRQWWAEEAASDDAPAVHMNPTSPHILAARAQLARVHLPRLTLHAPGRAHDEALVRELAQSFRGAVQNAYLEGEHRLDNLRGRPL